MLKKTIGKFYDYAIVNSQNSKDDLSKLLDESRIRVIEHFPPQTFFKHHDREKIRKDLGVEEHLVIFLYR